MCVASPLVSEVPRVAWYEWWYEGGVGEVTDEKEMRGKKVEPNSRRGGDVDTRKEERRYPGWDDDDDG